MSDMIRKTVKCAHCGTEHSYDVCRSYHVSNPGIDGKPYSTAMERAVLQCPECGYCGMDIDAPVTGKKRAALESPEYHQILTDNHFDAQAKCLRAAAWLSAKSDEKPRAVNAWLLLAWHLEDAGDAAGAQDARREAVKALRLLIETDTNAVPVITLLDSLRQLGEFEEASELAARLAAMAEESLEAEEVLYRVIFFEKEHIHMHDAAPYRMSEVI